MKNKLITDIKSLGSPSKAKLALRFFKTKKGEYGEGDQFLGVSVPETRKLIRSYHNFKLIDIKSLLENPWHEVRLAGLLILVMKYQKTMDDIERDEIVTFYLKNKKGINNWDLVDQTAYKILGDYSLRNGKVKVLKELIQSNHHWDRRIAMVSTLAFIRNQEFALAMSFAKKVFKDKEDLMHKAAGWMLREIGKKDPDELLRFIQQHGPRMPRTMLRYAIEKFSEKQRREILAKTRINKT